MRYWILFFLLCKAALHAEDEFFRLMGKNTPHWIHISKQEDAQALDLFANLYKENKDLRFREDGPYKIPKIIHLIWLGPRPFPPASVQNVRTWLAYHPDWKVKFWTDRERLPPCNDMEVCNAEEFPFLFLRKCYRDSDNWGEKSDILRFEILYQEGGLYVDHDANCLQPFNGLHRGYDFYCGLESPHPPFAGRNITSGNGVIGSKPFHPVVGGVIELIGKDWESLGKKYRGRDGYSKTQLVMERTYIKLTESLLKRLSEDENIDIVFPAAFFFAKKGIYPLYSKHFFANAWADDPTRDLDFEKRTSRALSQIKNRNHTIRMIGKGALSVNLMALGGIFLYLYRRKKTK